MNDLVVSLIVILVVGVLIALLFIYLGIRKRRLAEGLAQAARERGWQLQPIQQPLASGYLITGKAAFGSWSLETRKDSSPREAGPGSSEVSSSTRWWSQDVALTDEAVVIGPHMGAVPPAALQSFGGGSLLHLAFRKMLGEDAPWVEGLSPVEVGSKNFQTSFLCLASSVQHARRLLSPEVENMLGSLSPKFKPVIKFRSAGLEISLPTRQLIEAADLSSLVDLGRALVNAWQQGS